MAKIHTIDGVQYREVEREVRYGDQYIVPIVPLDGYFDITRGKPYKVTDIDPDGDPEFVDDAGDPNGLSEGEYVVLEPVTAAAADLSALESDLAAMKAKVAEMERQLAEVKNGAPEDRLNVGDFVKIGPVMPGVFSEGEYGKIIRVDPDGIPFLVESLDGKKIAFFRRDTLTRATDEEVSEAKRKLAEKENAEKWTAIGREPGEFKKGDVVRVLPAIRDYVQGHAPGTIGVVAIADGTDRPLIEANDKRYYDWIELVAPVESVVNLRVS